MSGGASPRLAPLSLRTDPANVTELAARRAWTPAQRAFAQARASRPLLIALPLYRRPDLAVAVVESLIACAAELSLISAEVVIYDDSPDDPELAAALELLLPRASAAFDCRLHRNRENLGFVGTCNQALDEAAARGMDALLLNSDTVVFPGALAEMARVARLDPMIGFVNPRSNNATLATLPFQDRFRHLPPDEAHQAWKAVARHLPEMSYVPTGVGFCLLIRWAILAEFGGFDEIYAAGYNEENDLIMRAGRRGYRAVLANHAFVWHEGSGSFGAGEETEARELANRELLNARYPEYWPLAQGHFTSPEQHAELLLGALAPGADGRLELAFDFSSFVPAHNGTFLAGAQLLEHASRAWRERFDIYVMCSQDCFDFHDYGRFGVERRDPHDPRPFAAIFRVGQPYEWGAVERLVLKGAVFGVFMLDTISLDCTQLTTPRMHDLWSFTLEHADFVAATSELTAGQLERRFAYGAQTLKVESLHSLDLADYRLPPAPIEAAPAEPGYLFVIGNHYWHKEVATTANALAAAYPERTVVVLAGKAEAGEAEPVDDGRYAPRGLADAPNIVRLTAGLLSDAEMSALYGYAGAIVLPSHYEGFGIPVLNALSARRPIFVRPLPVFEQMCEALGSDANVHVFATTAELVRAVSRIPDWIDDPALLDKTGDGRRTAEDIGRAIDAALERIDYARIVRRIRALHAAHDLASTLIPPPEPPPELPPWPPVPPTPAAFVAQWIGQRCERAVAMVLAIPGVFPLLRLGVRIARAPARAVLGRRPVEAAEDEADEPSLSPPLRSGGGGGEAVGGGSPGAP